MTTSVHSGMILLVALGVMLLACFVVDAELLFVELWVIGLLVIDVVSHTVWVELHDDVGGVEWVIVVESVVESLVDDVNECELLMDCVCVADPLTVCDIVEV